MSTILTHVGAYLSNSTPTQITLTTVDGASAVGVSVVEVLDDGLLIAPNPSDTTVRQYVPLTSILNVQVQD